MVRKNRDNHKDNVNRSSKLFSGLDQIHARISDLGMNVVLPWLYARTCRDRIEPTVRQRVIDRYFAWRAGEDNSALRLARNRLLPATLAKGAGGELRLDRAALQQGLLQVVRDYCEGSNAICEGCRLPEALQSRCAQI